MTREQAEELVWDLIDAYSNKLNYPTNDSFVVDFESVRERVVNHLATRETSTGWDWPTST